MDKWVHAFLKGIDSKVNVKAWLELELAYHNIAVQHINHYAMGSLPVHSVFFLPIDHIIHLKIFFTYIVVNVPVV